MGHPYQYLHIWHDSRNQLQHRRSTNNNTHLCKEGAFISENWLVNWTADTNLWKLTNGLLIHQWITVEWH
jgi:hypothetical protein